LVLWVVTVIPLAKRSTAEVSMPELELFM